MLIYSEAKKSVRLYTQKLKKNNNKKTKLCSEEGIFTGLPIIKIKERSEWENYSHFYQGQT